jgi:VCBS repeat-containing protein
MKMALSKWLWQLMTRTQNWSIKEASRRRSHSRPGGESLEVRLLLTTVSFDESVSGDLSALDSDNLFTVDIGTNVWQGTVESGAANDSNDSFTIQVPSTMQVASVRFQYTDGGNDDSGGISSSEGFSHSVSGGSVDVTNSQFDFPPNLPIMSDFTVTVFGNFAFPAAPWTVTVEVEALPSNLPPTANDDVYTSAPNTTLNVAAPGLLDNDSDPEGDALTVNTTPVSGPSNGTVTLNADGSFSYTPNACADGNDSFVYEIDDGNGNTDTATVYVAAAPITYSESTSGDLDNLAANDVFTVFIGTNVWDGTLLTPTDGNDSFTILVPDNLLVTNVRFQYTDLDPAQNANPDGGSISSSAPFEHTFGAQNGRASVDVTNSGFDTPPSLPIAGGGSFTVTVAAGFAAPAAPWTLTLEVVENTPPEALDDAYSTDEDTPLIVAAPGVLTNDSDVDGNNLSASGVTGPSDGTLVLNADGSFTYTPDPGFFGSDSFVYQTSDGVGGTDTATVSITVNPANTAPVANDDAYSTDEDTALVVGAAGILTNDTDVDGDSLTAAIVSGPSNGALVLNPDGSFTYTPDADFNGSDSFVYQAEDGNGGTTTATVDITIDPVNDAPSFVTLGGQTVPEDSGSHTVPGFATASPGGGADETGQTFTYNVSNDNSSLFSVAPAIDANGQLTYTLAPDANGTATVTVSVMDNGGTANGGADTSADQTFAITVLSEEEQIENLQEEIDDLLQAGVVNGGQANSMQSQLENTLSKIARGNERAARNQVNAFINHVLGLVEDGVLTEDQGDVLIGLAESIIASIM